MLEYLQLWKLIKPTSIFWASNAEKHATIKAKGGKSEQEAVTEVVFTIKQMRTCNLKTKLFTSQSCCKLVIHKKYADTDFHMIFPFFLWIAYKINKTTIKVKTLWFLDHFHLYKRANSLKASEIGVTFSALVTALWKSVNCLWVTVTAPPELSVGKAFNTCSNHTQNVWNRWTQYYWI